MELGMLFLSAVLINNFVLSQFLGICPFLGVSKKIDSALSMGMAVTFVMTITAAVTYAINKFLFHHPLLVEYELDKFLTYVMFIIVISSLVQFVEMVIRKVSQPLYQALGIYLPLITTNCAIMGLAILAAKNEYNFIESLIYGVGAGVGFTLAIVIMAGIREQLETADVPEAFQGAGITLISAGILALAFMGFSGLKF